MEAEEKTDRGLADLLRRLGDEASGLVRSEVKLAKLEMRESARELAGDSVLLAVALGLAVLGIGALTAAIIMILGEILGDRYWLAALLVAAVFLLASLLVAKRGIDGLKSGAIKPEATIETLQESSAWAKNEIRALKRDRAHEADRSIGA